MLHILSQSMFIVDTCICIWNLIWNIGRLFAAKPHPTMEQKASAQSAIFYIAQCAYISTSIQPQRLLIDRRL